MTSNKKKLITHNGSFHTDDIFAAATLAILLERQGEEFEIIRTRDEEVMKTADYIFDVGGVYDRENNKFDHHQAGGAGKGENNIDYSSFGLVWKKFGTEFCGSQKVADIICHKLVTPVDALDNGIEIIDCKYDMLPYSIQSFFSSMNPTWREESLSNDEMFLKSVEIAKIVLAREVAQAKDFVFAEEKVVSIYNETTDKRIIVLDKNYPCEYALASFVEPLFIIYPRTTTGDWGIKSLRSDLKTFKNRKDLPMAWAGLRDEELQKVSGVPDAVFCHRGLFMAVAGSREGAMKLAQIAVES